METVTLTVTIEPEDAANQNYTVTGPAGVIIDGTSVTFEDSITDTTTTAPLTVTTEDGDFTASVDLEVWDWNSTDYRLVNKSWQYNDNAIYTFYTNMTYDKDVDKDGTVDSTGNYSIVRNASDQTISIDDFSLSNTPYEWSSDYNSFTADLIVDHIWTKQ